jgi:hypothetical protein
MTLAAQAHFDNYNPADFGWGRRDPMNDRSLLVPFTHSGVSFGSMHRDVVGLFTALLDDLVPLIPGGLVDGQCGCYNPNSVTVGGSRSFHTYAIAIDVNWGSNPMYAKAQPTGLHALPPETSQIARRHGCEWGGDWSYPEDWMHIEAHLSPADARSVQPTEGFVMDAEAKAAFAALNARLDKQSAELAVLRKRFIGTDKKLHTVEGIVTHVVKGTPYPGAS